MGKKELKKHLIGFEKNQLIDLITDLYDNNKSVKEYLEYCINPNEAEILKIYKTKVREAFYPKRGFNYKLAVGKKAISEFKKLKPSAESIIDLLLWYVESGVEFTNEYGDINDAFYSSIESVFDDAMLLIAKNGLQVLFESRALDVLKKTENIGWGFQYSLSESYYETYE